MVAKKSDESTPTNLPVETNPVLEATTWDEVMRLAPEIYSAADVFGDGSVLIEKEELLAAGEFIVLDWRVVTDKKTLRDYVNVLVMNRANRKARFNDGSTGIMAQLLDYQERMGGRVVPVHCKGARKSVYLVDQPDGSKTESTTFYLY